MFEGPGGILYMAIVRIKEGEGRLVLLKPSGYEGNTKKGGISSFPCPNPITKHFGQGLPGGLLDSENSESCYSQYPTRVVR
jgi:hypothetical protein